MKVQILSRAALTALASAPFEEKTAVISITDTGREPVALAHQPDHLLRLAFDDVSDEIFAQCLGRKPTVGEMRRIGAKFSMLNNAQTRLLATFILKLEETQTLLCQCEHGQSRSAAVAAAVMEYYHRKGVHIFADARYYPNKYVFKKLLQALRTYGRRRRL